MSTHYLLPFAPGALRVVRSVRPMTAQEALRHVPGAVVAFPGPMFRICDEDATGYDDAACADPSYLLRDAIRGISEASEYPSRGGTFSIVNGVVQCARGDVSRPCAQVAVQGYPTVVWEGRNEAPTRGEAASATWRAALALMVDGRLAFALARATFPAFGEWLVASGATHAIYTDGGGSGTAAHADGSRAGSTEGRRLPSFLVFTSGATLLVPATMLALGSLLAAALADSGTYDRPHVAT